MPQVVVRRDTCRKDCPSKKKSDPSGKDQSERGGGNGYGGGGVTVASPPKSQVRCSCTLEPGPVLSRARVWGLRRIMARIVRSVKVKITVLVTVTFSCAAEHQVLVLTDTGCSIFAVAPRKCFPPGTLETARQQLCLSSVNSRGVRGGKLGTSVTVSLPICDSLGGLLCHCPEAFVYEAGVANDLILEWRVLVAYQLVPCPLESCIVPRESITVDMNRFQSDREQLRTNNATCGTVKCCAVGDSPEILTKTPAGGGGDISVASSPLQFFQAGSFALLSVFAAF